MKILTQIMIGNELINLKMNECVGVDIADDVTTVYVEDDWGYFETIFKFNDTEANKVLGAILEKCIATINELCDRVSTLEDRVANLY